MTTTNELFDSQKNLIGEYEIIDTIKAMALRVSLVLILEEQLFDMGSLKTISISFCKTIQDRQGMFVNSPHRKAFRNEFIG